MTRFTSLSKNRVLRFLLPPVFWLGVWQFAAMSVGKEILLPSPLSVFTTLKALVVTPVFWRTSLLSLVRIFAGFWCGAIAGTLVAVATFAVPLADNILSPAVRVIRATPVVSFIILVLLWIGSGLVPGVISALMVLPVLWEAVRGGLIGTDPLLLEMARAYRFGSFKTARLIYYPSVRPSFNVGCRTGLGLAWKAGVAAEVLCQPELAIGSRVYYSKITLDSPALFAWTLVVILLSFLLEGVISVLFRRLDGRAHL
ncbi:putative aliphatic sulfonates transport permease protein SsuC [bioreactor metagenome]|uniref:Putative aliphatic sulfonates transport permease protein SsuC n=1 Tax=bioreactor metagenome TaxID=1076179 RepID=A0A644W7B7_9ZZZZ